MAADQNLKVTITADDQASATIKGISSSLESNKATLIGVGAAAGVALAGVVAFASKSIDSANESAKVQAQLDAVLKSTGDTQDRVVKQFVATGGVITSTIAESAKQVKAHADTVTAAQDKIHGYHEQLQAATARLQDLTAAQKEGKLHTESQKESLILAREKVDDLNASIAKATGTMTVHGKTTTQLAGYYKDVTVAAQFTRQGLIDLSTELEATTTFSDEAVLSVENLLLTFTSIGKDVFPQATKTVLDMSIALGEDTKSASIQLGKALQDPILGITALRRVGVNFTDAQKNVIEHMVKTGETVKAQQLILAELNKEFGGSAVAAAGTFGGKMEQLKNQVDDVQESIGRSLIPILSQIAAHVVPVVAAIGKWIEVHPELTKWIIILTAGLLGLTVAVTALAGAVLLFSAVSWPIVGIILLIVAGVALLAAGVYLLIANWGKISAFFKGIWDDISKAFTEGVNAVTTMFSSIWNAFWNKVTTTFSIVWNTILNTVKTMMNFIVGAVVIGLNLLFPSWQEGLQKLVDFLVNLWNSVVSWITGTFIPALKGALDAISNVWNTTWKAIGDFFKNIWNDMSTFVGGIIDSIISKINQLLAAAAKIGSSVVNPIKSLGATIGAGLSGIGGAVSNAFNSTVQVGASVTKVNDAVITPNGQVIQTDPADYLFATKTPGSLAGGVGSVIVNIMGGYYLDQNAATEIANLLAGKINQNMKLRPI